MFHGHFNTNKIQKEKDPEENEIGKKFKYNNQYNVIEK